MIHVFYKNRHTVGQFMVALILLGTFGFLFTCNGFVSESQALDCCSGGKAKTASFAADSSGDFGSDFPLNAETTRSCCSGEENAVFSSSSSGCNCLGPDGPCSPCGSGSACGGSGLRTCPSNNPNCSVDTAVCANYCSEWCVQGNGGAPCQGKCDQ